MRIGQGYDVHRLVEGRKRLLEAWTFPMKKDFWVILTRMSFFML